MWKTRKVMVKVEKSLTTGKFMENWENHRKSETLRKTMKVKEKWGT